MGMLCSSICFIPKTIEWTEVKFGIGFAGESVLKVARWILI